MGEHDIPNNASIQKANTHYEHSVFEQPENTVYSLISADEHDRVLTDPAYRIQRKAETDLKAKIYVLAMEDYEKEKLAASPWREPLGKLDYENLIQAEVIIRKLDRKFRKLTKFHSRYCFPLMQSLHRPSEPLPPWAQNARPRQQEMGQCLHCLL